MVHLDWLTLLGEMFSVRFVPRLYNEEQLRLQESLETAVRRVGGWCETATSLGVEWSWLMSERVSELEDCCN
jgi:hypothetical protein